MEKGTVSLQVSRLIQYGLQRGLIAPEDQAYAANRMLALLGLREYGPQPVEEELHTPAEPLEILCQYAAQEGIIDPDTQDARDQFDTELMNCLMPRDVYKRQILYHGIRGGVCHRVRPAEKKASPIYSEFAQRQSGSLGFGSHFFLSLGKLGRISP